MPKKNSELILTTAWQNNAKWLKALRPLSKLYAIASDLRKSPYQNGKKSPYKAAIPVLVIGNITVGGSGKTPLIIALVKYLQNKDIQVGVISRGYGGDQSQMPMLVSKNSTPNQVGDEPCLIVLETGVAMAVGANRGQAIDLLLKNYPNLQFIISDDGLQHYALYRDDEWIVVDAERGFGNGKLFPEGFLREPLSRLDGATVIYHYANKISANKASADTAKPYTMFLQTGQVTHLINAQKTLKPQKIYALTGIGYPRRFFNSLQTLGFDVLEQPKPDHHRFVLDDIMPLQDLPIVVTAKDAVKLRPLINDDNQAYFDNIWVLPVEMQLSQGVLALMDNFLQRYVVKDTQ